MSILQHPATTLPTGTWQLDPVHSRIEFAVAHNGVSTFSGAFEDVSGTLDDEGLRGVARVDSITVDDATLRGHLLSSRPLDQAPGR